MAQQQAATEKSAHQESAAAVQQRAATSVLEETSVNQKELVDGKDSAASGSKCSRIVCSPHQNTAAPEAQDGLIVSPAHKNQHMAATNTTISFRCPANFDDVQISMFLSPLTLDISATAVGCSFTSVIFDSTQQKCSITFARA